MFEWLTNNIGTIIVLILLVIIIAAIIIKMIKDKKDGKSSCGCGCENCSMNGACNKK